MTAAPAWKKKAKFIEKTLDIDLCIVYIYGAQKSKSAKSPAVLRMYAGKGAKDEY